MSRIDPYGTRRRTSRQNPHRDLLAYQLGVEPGNPKVTEAIRGMYASAVDPRNKEWILEYFGTDGLGDLLAKKHGPEQ